MDMFCTALEKIYLRREFPKEAGNSFQPFSHRYNLMDEYYICLSSGGAVASWLVCSSPDRAVRVPASVPWRGTLRCVLGPDT